MTVTETGSSASSGIRADREAVDAVGKRELPAQDGAVSAFSACLILVSVLQAQERPSAESPDLKRIFEHD